MTGSKFYQKKQRIYFFLALYGILGLIGIAFIAAAVSRSENPSGAAGFMVAFGAGMAILTWVKGKKPLVVLHSDRLELNQTNRPELINYRDIVRAEQQDAKRFVLILRDGHSNRKVTIYTQHMDKADGEKLALFLTKKGWKRS
jgi:hypothetical protein